METIGRIWALMPEWAETLRSQTERLGTLASALEAMTKSAAADPPKTEGRAGSVAIVPVVGVISPRAAVFGVSARGLAATFRAAAADPEVRAIVADVSSPGGEVGLVAETAEAIRQARRVKPVVAVANPLAASAAYWIGSQATEFLVTPSGEAGSIGVYGMHLDMSAALEKAGLRVTLVAAGKYKVEGNPFGPLEEQARAAMQSDVDRYYDLFTRDVARGRRTTVEAVRGGFGEGRVVGAREAVSLGLADAVGTLEEGIRRASALGRGATRVAGSVAAAIEARVALEGLTGELD